LKRKKEKGADLMRVRLVTLGALILSIAIAAPVHGQQTAAPPLRTPDVIFVPTPQAVVDAMLTIANVTS
jgi:hypothetical protein